MHHLRNILDRHHLPFEHRKNFRERHRAHLHVPQRKLLPRDAPREIVHQLFLAHRKPLDDPPLLPLERFAFKHLWNPPPQKINSRLHIFLERVRLPSRQRKQPRPVGNLEIVDVAAVQRRFRLRVQIFDHLGNRPATARSRQSAHKYVVTRRRQFDAHLQGAQSTLLPDEAFAQFRLCRRLKRYARKFAPPTQFRRRQLRRSCSRF
jgi:hypothetical protein